MNIIQDSQQDSPLTPIPSPSQVDDSTRGRASQEQPTTLLQGVNEAADPGEQLHYDTMSETSSEGEGDQPEDEDDLASDVFSEEHEEMKVSPGLVCLTVWDANSFSFRVCSTLLGSR